MQMRKGSNLLQYADGDPLIPVSVKRQTSFLAVLWYIWLERKKMMRKLRVLGEDIWNLVHFCSALLYLSLYLGFCFLVYFFTKV